MKKELTYTADIPEDVDVSIEGKMINVKGEKGENKRLFHYPGIELKKEENKIILHSKIATKKEKSIMGVSLSHIKNMMSGVKEGFVYKLKICSGHFPMTVESKDKEIMINNFLGEKKPRIAKILEGADAKIDGEIITVESWNKELAGQTSANIEKATKISGRDRRIFQDGIFIIEKDGRKIE
ncbi:MAG: 50S ribosomal protein L6 [Nanoarchaeota archaeon]|nr:50S ribosomal protein L6 [Nanoarchaeota archaeon]|tara:strand:+ start:30 stop:575 length:546 start_codon:yes stop_codon:yes gene_type:complete